MKQTEPACAVTSSVQLPPHVEGVIGQLISDANVNQIWLIGSRANGSASATSDWDLLVLSEKEPSNCSRCCPGIDVLWCGPSGSTLVEGAYKHLTFQFSDFKWKAQNGEATYLDRKFTDVEYGVTRDASQPVLVRSQQRALLIWQRSKL